MEARVARDATRVTCDLLYVSHNRREFVQETFPALVKNTNWDRVARLHVLDDDSIDGTAGYLMSGVSELYARTGMKVDCISDRFGGPVAAMNYAVYSCDTDVIVKVDSDLLLSPGWLDVLLGVLDSASELDVLGFEAGFGERLHQPGGTFGYREASHVGGIGAFRLRPFRRAKPKGHGTFFGLTEWMRNYAECAWLVPDLPCVLLDHLPFEPWRSLAAEYCARGWSRPWPAYPEGMRDYWAWHFAEVAA